ncbi:MAG: hypothetical protein IT210_13295 [Armatimonadetes bacterium]|nr:hypothetical protein [Armatimonadota bacterium]
MNFLGIHLTLFIGPTVALPAPPLLMEALDSVEVSHSDEERSGFQIVFHVGRTGPFDLLDYPLVGNPLLKPFNRVILLATFNATPRVLMDGIITHHQLSPGQEPGTSTFTVMGEDISVMMDMAREPVEHPAQDETIIANKILLNYPEFGILPMVIPPPVIDPPIPIERTPVQCGSDLEYLNKMAGRYGYTFYIAPGPVPFVNIGYWGPPKRTDIPQSALSVNIGPESNVASIQFQNNALAPTTVSGPVQDRLTNQNVPVQTFASLRPPLSSQPAWLANQPNVRRTHFQGSGLNTMQAFARAQGIMDASNDAVTADGELDSLRYGNLLQARGLVGLRGAGYSYDGLYYVKRVTHSIRRGEYKQRFTLKRDGIGSTTPLVMP